MKKILTSILLAASAVCFACWFTVENFNQTYIYSVNSKHIHYKEVSSFTATKYLNGMSVDLPITVQIKVSPRISASGRSQIKEAVLQYKIVRTNGTSTKWITVKRITNVDWKLEFEYPVTLFGKTGTIDIPRNEISTGDNIIIRVYITDGVYETGDITADIPLANVPNVQSYTAGNTSCGNGWYAPHVFRVKFSGKFRPTLK